MPPNYDSLLGKLIVWGEDRPQAIARMKRALNELVISGVPTTVVYHCMILEIEDFVNGNVDTGFIPSHQAELSEPPPPREVRPSSISPATHLALWSAGPLHACTPARDLACQNLSVTRLPLACMQLGPVIAGLGQGSITPSCNTRLQRGCDTCSMWIGADLECG